jgi:hypothetical protein
MRKSRRMRWEGHVARMDAEKKNAYRILWESLKETYHQEDLDVGGGIILKWILGCCSMDWIFLAQDRDHWRGSCEHGNELFEFHKILGNS